MHAYDVSPIASSESMMVRSASNLSKMTTYLAAGKPSQLVPEPVQEDGVGRNCAWLQVTDAEDFSRLLRVNGTTKRNELGEKGKDGDLSLLCLSLFSHSSLAPPFHLITLSARNSMDCGIVRPICLAVFRLILSSNFVGCSTGRSAGLAPFKILSTKYATRL